LLTGALLTGALLTGALVDNIGEELTDNLFLFLSVFYLLSV
jgi:hypothetical protein